MGVAAEAVRRHWCVCSYAVGRAGDVTAVADNLSLKTSLFFEDLSFLMLQKLGSRYCRHTTLFPLRNTHMNGGGGVGMLEKWVFKLTCPLTRKLNIFLCPPHFGAQVLSLLALLALVFELSPQLGCDHLKY